MIHARSTFLAAFVLAASCLGGLPRVALAQAPKTVGSIPSSTLGLPSGPAQLDSGGTLSSILAYVPTTTLKVAIAQLLDQRFYEPEWWGALGNGTSNDTAAVQAAIAAAHGRAVVWLRASGTYSTNQINLGSGDHIVIDGHLIEAAGTGTNLLSSGTASNVIIEGSGIVDGNRANVTVPSGQTAACINLYAVTGGYVRGAGGRLTITNCPNYPINAWNNAANIDISYIEASNSGNSLECAAGVVGCYIDHIYAHNISDYAVSFYGGVTKGVLTNSRLDNNLAGGFSVLDDSGQPAPDSDILVQGNTASLNSGNGFTVFNSNTYPNHANVRFVGNYAYGNNQGLQSNYGGFSLQGCDNCLVADNESSSSSVGTTGTGGISVGFNIVSGNGITVSNNRSLQEGNGKNYGICYQMFGAVTRLHMEGNDCTDNLNPHVVTFAYNGGFGNNTRGQFLLNSAGLTIGTPFNLSFGTDTQVVMLPRDSLAVTMPNVSTGNSTSTGVTSDASGVRVALSGTAYTVPAGTDLVRMTQTATVATQTITLPAAISDGQPIQFVTYAGAITALTFSPAVQGWTNGSQLSANTGARIRWDTATSVWYREQ
ncbi:MAG: hypothetical protein ACRYG6_04780 [Janthinobacterium lividum]